MAGSSSLSAPEGDVLSLLHQVADGQLCSGAMMCDCVSQGIPATTAFEGLAIFQQNLTQFVFAAQPAKQGGSPDFFINGLAWRCTLQESPELLINPRSRLHWRAIIPTTS